MTAFALLSPAQRRLAVAAALSYALCFASIAAAAPTTQGGGESIKPDLLYHNYCSVCHGDHGDGKSRAANSLVTRPYDFTSARAKAELSRERIIAMTSYGKPGTAMVGWRTQLNEREIAALADYILAAFTYGTLTSDPRAISGTRAHGGRETQAIAAAAPAGVDMTLPFPNGLKGNAARGRPFYDANCATCHGKLGDGKGPRAYFINPKPRNLIEPAAQAQFNRPALYTAVAYGRNGTEMPAWNKVLETQQIADVSEYVFTAFIQPKAVPSKAKK